MGDNEVAMSNHVGNRLSRSPNKTTFGIHAKALFLTVAQTGMCRVLLTTVSVMAEDWEQPECPSIGS